MSAEVTPEPSAFFVTKKSFASKERAAIFPASKARLVIFSICSLVKKLDINLHHLGLVLAKTKGK
jgi:hypothetical protein